jgi:ankyrin repeat protein
VGKQLDDKLIQAVYDENEEEAIALIKKGADIDARNHKGQTVLALAANRGLKETAELLLEKGTEVDSRDQWGQTPLMRAAYNRHTKTVELLLDHGADIHARNSNGKSPILYAADGGSKKAFKLLLLKGADIDDTDDAGASVLMYFTMHDKTEILELILKQCSNKDQLDWNGKSALDYALEEGFQETALILKRAGVPRGGTDGIERKLAEKHPGMIKKVRCHSCGAPKINDYSHAYLYCDFCGAFMDFDYHLARQLVPAEKNDTETEALRQQNRLYSTYSIIDWMTYPEYLAAEEQLRKEGITPESQPYGGEKYLSKMCDFLEDRGMAYPFLFKVAREQADTERYARLKVKREEQLMDEHPGVFSPKIADDIYRREYLRFIYESNTRIVKNDTLREMMSELNLRETELLYDEHYIDSTSFWVQFDLTKKFRQAWAEELDRENIFSVHPDGISKDQFINLQQTLFLQSWFPKLSPEDTKKALEITDKLDTFTPVEPAELDRIGCPACGTIVARG